MSSRQPQRWIGFFDLLGTKDSAKSRQSDFPGKVKLFGRTLAQQAAAAQSPTRLRFFSDAAYVECEDPTDLIEYCRRVRKLLFGADAFFKSAIGVGNLDEEVIDAQSLGLRPPKHVDIVGTTFGPSVTALNYLQEDYKGVGVRVCGSAQELKPIAAELVDSCFPRGDDFRQWVEYKDVAYKREEVGSLFSQEEDPDQTNIEALAFLDSILIAAMRANANRKNLSRYYISTMLTAITSSDFSGIRHSSSKWFDAPPVFHHMFVNRRTRQNYLNLPGAHCLYFRVANQILTTPAKRGRPPRCEDSQQAEVCNAVVSALIRFKVLTGTLKSFPAAVLDHTAKEHIVRRAVTLRMGGDDAH